MPTRVAIVPHTHWDREWYSPFQTFRHAARQAARRAAADARVRPVVLALPARRADRGARRLPRGAARGARPRSRRLAAAGRLSIGPWMVLMDEFMVSGETMVRDLQFGIARGARARRRDGRRLPARHVRPRRADAAAAAARRLRARGRVARRPRAASSRPRSGGRRPTARGCAPSTSTARTRTVATSPTTRSGSCCAPSTTSRSSAPARLGDMLLMNGTDHQMPQPWLGRVVAEANAIQDDYEFVVTSLPEYLPHAADRPGSSTVARRAALGRAREPAHGRRLEPGRRAPGVRGGRAGARTAGRAAVGAVPARRRSTRTRSLDDRVAQPRAQQRARLVVRVQPRRGRRPGRRALRRSAPDRRRA